MELRLTLVDPQRTGASLDVAISAPPGTLLSAITEQLMTALGSPRPAQPGPYAEPRFRCGRARLEASTPLGLPPLLDGAVLVLVREPIGNPAGNCPEDPLLEAHVIAGPDAGTVRPLAAGRHSIGRAGSNSIRLADLDASRVHAELIVNVDRIEIRDAGSSNGTWLRGQRIHHEGELLRIGDRIALGASTVAVRCPDRPPAAAMADGEGHLRINRSPQLRPARMHHEVGFPTAPAERSPARFAWLAMLLPLLLAVPMAVFWKQPTFLLFALMTPMLMAGQFVTDRRSAGRDARERQARYETAGQQSQAALAAVVAADSAYLEASRPDLARLTVTARTPTDELWRRATVDSDCLLLRLGRGAEPAAVTARRPSSEATGGHEAGPRVVPHPDVPIAVDLREARILGICGPRTKVLGLARSLIGQVAVLHSPNDVWIDVLTADPAQRRDWRWVRWLPHHQPNFTKPGEQRSGELGYGPAEVGGASGSSPSTWRIIVLDGAHILRRRADVAVALRDAARDRTEHPGTDRDQESLLFICLDHTEQELPVECGCTVTLDAATAGRVGADPTALLRRSQAPDQWVTPDLAGARWAERLSRYLAPLRDGTPEPNEGLPSAVSLIELLTNTDLVHPTDPIDLARYWRRSARQEPVATLGGCAGGAFRIDLRRDGPHVLIAGTTGAGKSELLQTMVAALAVSCAPDAISFLLIDYKGGAAFRDCAALPQVGGMITDLDPHLARRALASLAAELRRRERLLNSASSVDVDAYTAARIIRPDLPPMPRLVVVVDEFRVLAEELPEFVSGLVRTATVGRSLGVHLVLATQRPTGIVSAEISANANLRIALRLRDAGDSRDLIDDPAAARLPDRFPGRALARSGTGPLTAFQTARVSGRSAPASGRSPVVRRLDPDLASAPSIAGPGSAEQEAQVDQATGDLAAIAAAARSAATYLDLAPVSPPWLPPLPTRLTLETLPAMYPQSSGHPRLSDDGDDVRERQATSPTCLPEVPFGLIDLPDEQRQRTVAWRLGGSHLAVAGGPRSGRTTVLRTIVQAASTALGARESHLYLIDGSGALAALEHSSQVEAVLPVHDTERAERLLRRLDAEIAARQARIGTEPAPAGDASVLLLIDGWESLTSSWADVDHGRLIEQLLTVLRDGPAVSVFAAISGGRSLLTGPVSALLAERVVLRFADPADAMLAGVPASRTVSSQPAGRGVLLSPEYPAGSEIQVAMACETWAGRPDSQATADPSGQVVTGDRTARPGWRIPALPRRLEYEQLLAALPSHPRPKRDVPIGIGGDDAVPLGLDLWGAPVTLLIGPPGSGRTSALQCIAEGLRRAGEPVLMVSGAEDPEACLAARLSMYPGATILLDDVPTSDPLGESRSQILGELLAAHLGSAGLPMGAPVSAQRPGESEGTRADPQGAASGSRGARLVVASAVGDVLAAYRGVLALARTARSGLILGHPAPGDSEVFGLRIGRRPPGPPGRALLVQAGRASPVQLSLPPPVRNHCPSPEGFSKMVTPSDVRMEA